MSRSVRCLRCARWQPEITHCKDCNCPLPTIPEIDDMRNMKINPEQTDEECARAIEARIAHDKAKWAKENSAEDKKDE